MKGKRKGEAAGMPALLPVSLLPLGLGGPSASKTPLSWKACPAASRQHDSDLDSGRRALCEEPGAAPSVRARCLPALKGLSQNHPQS